jgi:hypothetical protein
VLREGGVVIALSPSSGWIDPDRYPFQRLILLYDRHHDIRALVDHETFHGDPDSCRSTGTAGYPALHAFWSSTNSSTR